MKNNSSLAIVVVVVLLVVIGFVYFVVTPKATAPVTGAATTIAATANNVTYSCDSGKTIAANYYATDVALTLSDGRTFTLPQVQSGSGIRYEQAAGTPQDITFSSEGDNAMLMENNSMTYSNCVAGTATASTTTGTQSFTDQGKTFTFSYPSTVQVSGGGGGYTQDWMINSAATGLLLVKATLPSSFEPKTNFADATFTVGTSPDPGAVAQCLSTPQSGTPTQKSQVIINGTTFTKFITNDAGAGNIYQTTSYRTLRSGQCYAVEYTIHSSNIGNYSPDQGITAFNQARVTNVLEGMVASFKFI